MRGGVTKGRKTMEEKQETSANIVAEIRARAKAWPEPSLVQYDERLADRLEAALKREKAEIEAEALAAGGIVEAERHKPGNTERVRYVLEVVVDQGDALVGGNFPTHERAREYAEQWLHQLRQGGISSRYTIHIIRRTDEIVGSVETV